VAVVLWGDRGSQRREGQGLLHGVAGLRSSLGTAEERNSLFRELIILPSGWRSSGQAVGVPHHVPQSFTGRDQVVLGLLQGILQAPSACLRLGESFLLPLVGLLELVDAGREFVRADLVQLVAELNSATRLDWSRAVIDSSYVRALEQECTSTQ
jgi:hypothetical protein